MDSHYIRTSPDHYRCYEALVTETKSIRVTDTILFKHRHLTNPTVSVADEVSTAAANLTEVIKGNMHRDLSKLKMEELERLASIFQEAASKIAEQDARQPGCQGGER